MTLAQLVRCKLIGESRQIIRIDVRSRFSIMHNVFVNQRRSPRPGVELDPGKLPDAAVQATPFDRIVLDDVEKALQSISIGQREVLLLIAVEQMSYEETAKALAIPIGTVMSQLSRARERLRQLTGRASRI
jgi:RNA polymerase sigma-70 factor, ECF subfamily